MKVIIEAGPPGSILRTAAQDIEDSLAGRPTAHGLSFGSARALFSDLTPPRMSLLGTLRRIGPSSITALAKAAERKFSNVETDVARLAELGLIEWGHDGNISVPFDAMEIHLQLAEA